MRRRPDPRRPAARPPDGRVPLRRPRLVELLVCLAAVVLLAVPILTRQLTGAPAPRVGASAAGATPAPVGPQADVAAPVAPVGRVSVAVRPFSRHITADVLVTSTAPLAPAAVRRLTALAGSPAYAVPLRQGSVRVGTSSVSVTAADPSTFRDWTPKGTAELDGVWTAMAGGELVAAHATARRLHLPLGGRIAVAPAAGSGASTLRVGALATTGVPGVQLVVSDPVAAALRLPATNAVLLSAGGRDPGALAKGAQGIVGAAATVRQLTIAAIQPQALLTGGAAARAFGSFTYRYGPGAQIIPDPAWVRANIRTESVPILGPVTCHRLMLPQLRAALAEVVRAGLSAAIDPGDYGGCYNPRFQDHNPSEPVSLHAWGIAIDLNVHQNERGTAGLMDRRVVTIFKRWGFAWGGDWSYTDPMHFQIAELVKT